MTSFEDTIEPKWLPIYNSVKEERRNEISKNYTKENTFPLYKNIFKFTHYTKPEKIRVVIIGQDCYHGTYIDSKGKEKCRNDPYN